MEVFGITGGIGSGKSTVASLFEKLGIPVYYADKAAKALQLQEPIKTQISEEFGSKAYLEDGSLNRKYLSNQVFGDKKKLDKLNSIVHPAVAAHFEKWKNDQTATYGLKEAAIIFELGQEDNYAGIILVKAPEQLRVERVCERDNTTAAEVKNRMAQQWSDEKKSKLADFIIENDGAQSLIKQVLAIHRQILSRKR